MKLISKVLILIFILSCGTSETESIEILELPQPDIILNCNLIESSDEVLITINTQVITKDKKLFNGSIKGQGLAKDFYKSLPDLNQNFNYNSEFSFYSEDNGSYTISVLYENSDGVYICFK